MGASFQFSDYMKYYTLCSKQPPIAEYELTLSEYNSAFGSYRVY